MFDDHPSRQREPQTHTSLTLRKKRIAKLFYIFFCNAHSVIGNGDIDRLIFARRARLYYGFSAQWHGLARIPKKIAKCLVQQVVITIDHR